MVSPLVILLGLGLAAAAASGSSSRRRYAPASRRGMRAARVCTLPPSGVSLEDADEQDRWTRCAGRRFEDVQALAGRLTAAGRVERASAVIELYNRRRAVEDAPPDPGAVSPETRAEVDRTVSASDDEARALDVPPAPETTADHDDATPPPPARRRRGATTPRGTSAPSRARDATDYADPARPQPAGFNPSLARVSAPELRDCLNRRAASACRRRIRQFQTAAGITTDGLYGPITHAALVYWLRQTGASDPPPPTPHGAARTYAPPGSARDPHELGAELMAEARRAREPKPSEV